MKKFLCLLLIFTLSAGAFAVNALAEDTAESAESAADTDTSSAEPAEEGSAGSGVQDTSSAAEASGDPSEGDSSEPVDSSADDSSTEDSSAEDSSNDDSSNDDSSNDSSDDDSSGDESGEECAVSVKTTGGGRASFDGSKTYREGDDIELELLPGEGMGVKSVTVNGEALEGVAVRNGEEPVKVSVKARAETEIEVEFAEVVRVIIGWGLGGSVTANGGEIPNNGGFYVIKGGDLVVRIRTNANQAIEKVVKSVNGNAEDVTKSVKYGIYTIKEIENGCVIDVTFRETGTTDVETYTITVNVEGSGRVEPEGSVQVKRGDELILTLTPDPGCAVQSVTDRGRTQMVSSNTYTVKDIYEDGTVTVVFTSSSSSGDDSSRPDEESRSPGSSGDYFTREEIEKLVSGSELWVDVSLKGKIGKDALDGINQLLKNGTSVSIGVSGKYWWLIPAGASFATADLAEDGINFGVSVNDGDLAEEVKRLLEASAVAEYDVGNLAVVERAVAAALPAGTRLQVYGESFVPGQKLDWLRYDPISKSFSPMSGVDGPLVKVDNSRKATVDLPFPERYGVLVCYRGQTNTVSFTWDGDHCTPSVVGTVSVGADGLSSSELFWKSGKDVSVSFAINEGFSVQEISSADFPGMTLTENGRDVTQTAARGAAGTVNVEIKAISRDGHISVSTVEGGGSRAKASAAVPWDVIILVAVIVVAMVAGGIVFVIKWRQGDDDDDDDDEYAEGDDEDDEDEE